MKKIIFGGIAVVAIAVAMALSVSLNAKNNNLSSISLANVEALTQPENPMCPTGCYEGSGGCGCNGLFSWDWYHPNYWDY